MKTANAPSKTDILTEYQLRYCASLAYTVKGRKNILDLRFIESAKKIAIKKGSDEASLLCGFLQ